MTDLPPSAGPPPGAPSPGAGRALSYGWARFQENAGVIVGVILLPVVAQLVLVLIGRAVVQGFAGILVVQALGYLVALVAAIGIFNVGLMVTAGETPDLGRAFSSDRWPEWIGFSFVFALLVGIGALFFGIGALVVIAFFGLAPFFFIDRQMSLGDALNASLETTRATPGLPLALALTALVGWLGVLACLVGVLVTMPVAYVGAAFLYRHATKQPVA